LHCELMQPRAVLEFSATAARFLVFAKALMTALGHFRQPSLRGATRLRLGKLFAVLRRVTLLNGVIIGNVQTACGHN
jgi:hypothetical protein